jgi:hypothetical protein
MTNLSTATNTTREIHEHARERLCEMRSIDVGRCSKKPSGKLKNPQWRNPTEESQWHYRHTTVTVQQNSQWNVNKIPEKGRKL